MRKFLLQSRFNGHAFSAPALQEESSEGRPSNSAVVNDSPDEPTDATVPAAPTTIPPEPVKNISEVKMEVADGDNYSQIVRLPTSVQFEELERQVATKIPQLEQNIEELRKEFEMARENQLIILMSKDGQNGQLPDPPAGNNSSETDNLRNLAEAYNGAESENGDFSNQDFTDAPDTPATPAQIRVVPLSSIQSPPSPPPSAAPPSAFTTVQQLPSSSPMPTMDDVNALLADVLNVPSGSGTPTHGVFFNGGAEYYCNCGRKMSSRKGLLNHIRRFTTERKFKCKECTGIFFTLSELRHHMRGKHNSPDAFEKDAHGCTQCGLAFQSRFEFCQHYKSVHSSFAVTSKQG